MEFMASPYITGVYKGFAIGVFTSEHNTDSNTGTTRKLTAVEVELDSVMSLSMAVGNGGMVSVIQAMNLAEEFRPENKGWNPDNIVRAEDRRVAEKFLTDERIASILSLMAIKNHWVIFASKGNDTVLRVDLPDPLESEGKLSKLIDSMIEVAKVFELGKGEFKRLEAIQAIPKPVKKTQSEQLEIDENDFDTGDFELEESEEIEVKTLNENVLKSADSGVDGDKNKKSRTTKK